MVACWNSNKRLLWELFSRSAENVNTSQPLTQPAAFIYHCFRHTSTLTDLLLLTFYDCSFSFDIIFFSLLPNYLPCLWFMFFYLQFNIFILLYVCLFLIHWLRFPDWLSGSSTDTCVWPFAPSEIVILQTGRGACTCIITFRNIYECCIESTVSSCMSW